MIFKQDINKNFFIDTMKYQPCTFLLQIIFVIGILTGISLCIAGSVLRRSNRGGDLGVLVYIGCLAAMVCAVLLGVQCCVRRKNKQRCKQMRMRTAPPDCIPLDTIPVSESSAMRVRSNKYEITFYYMFSEYICRRAQYDADSTTRSQFETDATSFASVGSDDCFYVA